MKTMRKLWGLFMVAVMVCTTNMPEMMAYSDESFDMGTSLYSEWINEDGSYEFPIDQYDDEWYALDSAVEMREVTQIPEALLDVISTEELINLIIKYPLLCDMKAYSTLEEGYYVVKERFNGIQELVAREDAYSELLKAYVAFDIPEERLVDYESIINSESRIADLNAFCANKNNRNAIYDDAAVNNALNILEFMLLDIMETREVDENRFSDIYIQKVSEKTKSAYFENTNAALLLDYMDESSTRGLSIAEARDSSYSIIMISTPEDNVAVSVKYYPTLTMCSVTEDADLIAEYGATYISAASSTFNCHSYAWLHNLRSDYQHIWMNYATQFAADSYYEESTVAQVGDIAYWGAHSAQVIEINVKDPEADKPENICVSKWDDGPMVRHYMKRCPYYDGSSIISYYRPAE
ncbi:MAG: hypothetical protein J6B50_03670 [Lachnospiraceae bacterium]|nr:hypothetical protein [Lachnospiraceae bacterium]MBP3595480.1 hypothetical protein [Lachnospiraceae bacterium]